MEGTEAFGYELVVSFPDQSPSFAHGFEAGKIYERLSRINVGEGSAASFVTLILPGNGEVVRRIAEAKGWKVEIEPSTEAPNDWHKAEFTKVRPSRDRPNPHGLRVVEE
jgi:hypothetical protein